MLTNYHCHTIWCDGKNTPREMLEAALAKGFAEIGFSPHAQFPECEPGSLALEKADCFVREIAGLQAEFALRIRVRLGVEADYIPGRSVPERAVYAALKPEYVIGSVHYVATPNGRLCVDDTPARLRAEIDVLFGGSVEAFVRGYFAQQREMVRRFDFDVVGHPDLVRKFNGELKLFREDEPWYRAELERTADAIAASGKIVEVNTGAISRGWMDDAYPSAEFRAMLRSRGVKFILSSDAHTAATQDCAFDRFGAAEEFVRL